MISASGFVTQPPDGDLPVASQSTLLLQKKKEMNEVQQQLDRKKEEFRARMQRCQEKEVDLAARQEDIKEQVRKFDKFLKDNDAKRVRADRKVQEEKKARDQKENERLEQMEQKRLQDEKRAELKLGLESAGKYQRFLDLVCEEMSEYFEGIENITMRYETLHAAHEDLRERVANSTREMEDKNDGLVSYVRDTSNNLLVFNSEIATKSQKLDELRFAAQLRETKLDQGSDASKEAIRSLGEVKMAIDNIYGRARIKKGQVERATDIDTLEAIKKRVVDLQWIVQTSQAAMREAGKSAQDVELAELRRPRLNATATASSPTGAAPADGAGAGEPGASSKALRSSQAGSGSAAPQSQAGSTMSGPASKSAAAVA